MSIGITYLGVVSDGIQRHFLDRLKNQFAKIFGKINFCTKLKSVCYDMEKNDLCNGS